MAKETKENDIHLRLTANQYIMLNKHANKKRISPSEFLQRYIKTLDSPVSCHVGRKKGRIATKITTECRDPAKIPESSISGISKNPVKLDIAGMTPEDIVKFSLVAIYRLEDELSRCLGFEKESVDTLKKWKHDYELLIDAKGQDTSQIDRAIYSQYPILVDKVASNHRMKIRPLMYMIQSYLGELKQVKFFKDELVGKSHQYQMAFKYQFDSTENGVTAFFHSREYVTDHFRSCPPPNKELIEQLMADRDFFYMNLRNEKN